MVRRNHRLAGRHSVFDFNPSNGYAMPINNLPPGQPAPPPPPPPPPVPPKAPEPVTPQAPNTGTGKDSNNSDEKVKTMMPELQAAAKKAGIPVDVLAGVMAHESEGYSVNQMKHLNGLMQLDPNTFGELAKNHPELRGLDPMSEEGQIMGAAFLLKEAHDKAGNWDGALALYNGGMNGGGHLNDPNYLNALHETIHDIDFGQPLPS